MLVKKTVTEWLSFVKLEEKKITKRRMELLNKGFVIKLAEVKAETTKEEILSKFKSLASLEKNINVVRDKISTFNAETKITVSGKSLSIAHALHLWKKKDDEEVEFFKELYRRFKNSKRLVEEDSQYKIADLEKNVLNKANASKTDREFVESKKIDLAVEIIDPLNIEKTFLKVQDEREEFMADVNVQINLKNSTTFLEIDLQEYN
ncbi:MAG: hypothetical protein ACRC0G_16770 [Fusobacteriaceae bacterium]